MLKQLFSFFFSPIAHIYCEEKVFGILGENFTFPVKADNKIDEVIWTKDKDKVAEWEAQSEPTYFNSLRSRSLLNKESGNLTIFKLENSDSGTYQLERFSSHKENGVFTFKLTVLGKYGRTAQRTAPLCSLLRRLESGVLIWQRSKQREWGTVCLRC